MPKLKSYYICSECGYKTSKWLGRCPECDNWNTFIEEVERFPVKGNAVLSPAGSLSKPTPLNEIDSFEKNRVETGISEFDRCLGGIVNGQAILISGEPGIGKSTLLLQVAYRLAESEKNNKVYYINGEESNSQVKIRAGRLGIDSPKLFLFAENNIDIVIDRIKKDKPDVVFVDSLQTGSIPRFDSLPGSVVQVRECAYELVNLCKSMEIPLLLVSHITKAGNIAGPKIVEHIVDTVLFLEADERGYYRILRSLKNRFFVTDEMGLFTMGDKGMEGIEDAGTAFTRAHDEKVHGISVFPYLDGNRVFPVEVQALCSPTQFNYPKRAADGMESNRLLMLIAIIEKCLKINLMPFDIYVNITGGLRINDPALDLSVIFAIYSSYKEIPFPADTAIIGEVGLTGETRPVVGLKKRVAEIGRLGFKSAVVPYGRDKWKKDSGPVIMPIKTIQEGVKLLG